ncbi:MAG: acyl-CoA thioesterase [Ignavibacteriaceae bacterium]|nr:acyl-CoA thioesterase [Ignavibacteriaceae bacterium]
MFISKRKINFYDCDAAGILFYARIYELCHSVYEEMIQSFNLKEDYWSNEDYVVPIIHSEANYKKPLVYNSFVEIELSVRTLSTSAFKLFYSCKNEAGEICVEVETTHVFVDKKTWKKKSIKDDVRAGLTKHLKNN